MLRQYLSPKALSGFSWLFFVTGAWLISAVSPTLFAAPLNSSQVVNSSTARYHTTYEVIRWLNISQVPTLNPVARPDGTGSATPNSIVYALAHICNISHGGLGVVTCWGNIDPNVKISQAESAQMTSFTTRYGSDSTTTISEALQGNTALKDTLLKFLNVDQPIVSVGPAAWKVATYPHDSQTGTDSVTPIYTEQWEITQVETSPYLGTGGQGGTTDTKTIDFPWNPDGTPSQNAIPTQRIFQDPGGNTGLTLVNNGWSNTYFSSGGNAYELSATTDFKARRSELFAADKYSPRFFTALGNYSYSQILGGGMYDAHAADNVLFEQSGLITPTTWKIIGKINPTSN